MTFYIGKYCAKIDDKGRLVFPSAFKTQAAAEMPESVQFVVKKSLYSPCLEMYSYPQWEQESNALRNRLNFFNPKHAQIWRKFTSERAIVTPDEKTGRILIPRELLQKIGATQDVIFAGSDFIIELWDKQTYQDNNMSDEEYAALAEELLS